MSQQALFDALTEAATWFRTLPETGGPDMTILAHKKTAEEAQELADDPCLEEWADVVICLVGTYLGQKWTLAQVAEAVAAKNAKNAARTWAQQPDGTWHHVKQPAEAIEASEAADEVFA